MKIILVAMTFLFGSLVISFSQEKISPLTRMMVKEISTNKNLKNELLSSKKLIGAMIRVNEKIDESLLKSLNVSIGTKAGNIWTIRLSAENLKQISEMEGIEYFQIDEPIEANLDIARRRTNTDTVYLGTGLVHGSHKGKNVIVGIVDQGFDYTHPTFYDSVNKQIRILKVWEQYRPGTAPTGYNFGNELKTIEEMYGAKTDTLYMSHGTHVTAIAAGNGNGSNGLYRGIAPEADIIIVALRRVEDEWVSTGVSSVVDGFGYIYKYADSVKKPAVINLSWGSTIGPHDGSSLFNQACNNLIGKGKILAISAGNDGANNKHLYYKFSTTDSIFKSMIKMNGNPTAVNRWLDIWGEKDKKFGVCVQLFDTAKKEAVGEPIFISSESSSVTDLSIVNNNDTCIVNIATSPKEFNGNPRIFFKVKNTTKDLLLLSCKSLEGSVHLWNNMESFQSGKYTWAIDGSSSITINGLTCDDSIISVGAYATKLSWTDSDGSSWRYTNQITEDLAYFSSKGPTITGKTKPDIAAPGHGIVSALNSYDSSYYKGGINRNSTIKSFLSGGRNYSYGMMSGTSMSSPVVTGIIALMLEAKPDLTPSEIKYIFSKTAIIDKYVTDVNKWGVGKINTYNALRYLDGVLDVEESNAEMKSIIYPNPNDGKFTIDLSGFEQGNYNIEIFNSLGIVVYQVTINIADVKIKQIENCILQKGAYFLRISGTNKNVINKFVVY